LQKRSHKLLARSLMDSYDGFEKRRFELAFLFGSFQPDCNPLSYLKGTFRAKKFGGHNYSNSRPYIDSHIDRLRQRGHWTVWQYYTLGKLTHYLADAYTFPHNDNYPDSLMEHRRYENSLRQYLARYLPAQAARPAAVSPGDLTASLRELHREYMDAQSDQRRDARYILAATTLLMAGVLPQAVLAAAAAM